MEEKALFERARDIYDVLNSLRGDSHNPIGEFIEGETNVFKRVRKASDDDDILPPVMDAWRLAFSLGYAIGNMADVTDPDVIQDINAMKDIIREKGILPYLPRERRTA